MDCKVTIDKRTVKATLRKLEPRAGDIFVFSLDGATELEINTFRESFLSALIESGMDHVAGVFTNYVVRVAKYNVGETKNVFVVANEDKETIQELRNEIRWQAAEMYNSVPPGTKKSNSKKEPTRFTLALRSRPK